MRYRSRKTNARAYRWKDHVVEEAARVVAASENEVDLKIEVDGRTIYLTLTSEEAQKIQKDLGWAIPASLRNVTRWQVTVQKIGYSARTLGVFDTLEEAEKALSQATQDEAVSGHISQLLVQRRRKA